VQNQENDVQQMQEQWDRAVERAIESERNASELAEDALNDAVGLRVQSGAKGGWTGSCFCSETCAPCVT
jgi:hypothetical protein